jgi:hypothetical protein
VRCRLAGWQGWWFQADQRIVPSPRRAPALQRGSAWGGQAASAGKRWQKLHGARWFFVCARNGGATNNASIAPANRPLERASALRRHCTSPTSSQHAHCLVCTAAHELRAPPTRSPNTRPAAMDSIDVSNFDLNAILRGAQLTLVGGRSWPRYRTATRR